MGILGLTHDERGEVVQRLPVAIKVAIGLGPNEQRNYPTKLDHFVVLRKIGGAKWEPDPELTKLYGAKPTELGIVLLDDEPDNVFKTSYAWWTQTECKCRGELVQIANGGNPRFEMRATRRTERAPDGEEWPPKDHPRIPKCGDGCPDLERGDCKPSGDLYFILDKLPMLGAICRLHTTSYRSVRQIHAGLQQIRQVTGGRLAGIRAMLKVRPEKAAYEDNKGQKKTTTVWVLSLEISAADMEKLISNMTETAKLFDQTRKLLGGRRVMVVEEEKEIAPEIAREFHAPEDEPRALPPKAQIPEEELALQRRVQELAAKLGHNDAWANMQIGQKAGRLPELIAALEKQLELAEFLDVEPEASPEPEAIGSPTPANTASQPEPGRAASKQSTKGAATSDGLNW